MIPENLLKYGVALLLTSFGTFWAVEGTGVFRRGHESVAWPGSDAAILVLIVAWFVISQILIRMLRVTSPDGSPPRAVDVQRASA
jgi:uncharacterized membrane protein